MSFTLHAALLSLGLFIGMLLLLAVGRRIGVVVWPKTRKERGPASEPLKARY